MSDLRKFINLLEDGPNFVPSSQSYTLDASDPKRKKIKAITSRLHRSDPKFKKLADDFQTMDVLINQMEQAKQKLTGRAGDLARSYDTVADGAATRIVQMGDLILTHVPEHEEERIDFESVVLSLASHLTPELIKVLERLKKEYTILSKVGARASIKRVNEDTSSTIEDHVNQVVNGFEKWDTRFGEKLNALRDKISEVVGESQELDEGFIVDEVYIRTAILNSLNSDKHIVPVTNIDGTLVIHDKTSGAEYLVTIEPKKKAGK